MICTSSIGARLANPLLGMYHASKYGMTAWAEAMRLEMLPFGVRVHVVEPGMVNTDFPAATIATGAIARGEGPYVPLLAQLRTGFRSWRERLGVGAEDVAAAIVATALDDDARFRIPVGPDAIQMSAARDELGDEDFHAWQMRFLGLTWDREQPVAVIGPVVVAPAAFKGALSAAGAARAIAAGIQLAATGTEVRLVPVADGGEGTLDALVAAREGRRRATAVADPLGRPTRGGYRRAPRAHVRRRAGPGVRLRAAVAGRARPRTDLHLRDR